MVSRRVWYVFLAIRLLATVALVVLGIEVLSDLRHPGLIGRGIGIVVILIVLVWSLRAPWTYDGYQRSQGPRH